MGNIYKRKPYKKRPCKVHKWGKKGYSGRVMCEKCGRVKPP